MRPNSKVVTKALGISATIPEKIIKEIQVPSDFDYLANNCVSIIEQVLIKYENQIKDLGIKPIDKK